MVDQDGKYSFSKIILFDLGQQTGSLRLFPNPVVNSVTVSISQAKPGIASIRISDMRGVAVKNYTQSLSNGTNSLSFDCSKMASGTYLLTITNPDGSRLTEKLVIRH